MKLRHALLYPSALVLAVGCAPQSPPAPAVDLAAEEQAVRAVSMEWLALEKTRNAAGIAALFAEEGTIFRENQDPKVGAAAIETHMTQEYAANPSSQVNWTTDRVEVAANGDLAVEYGTWTMTGVGPGGTEVDNGKYVTAYRKVDGTWKVVGDISVSTKPEATAPTP